MSEEDKEFLRNQLETFNTQQEVCDLLGISVEKLLRTFDEELQEYACLRQ
jgi:hypothetical protein